tara:strand:- start:14806 stop:15021 length:216 start_codon:yes stop_codon:yes gene_type:complete
VWYQRFAGYKREGLYPLPLYKEKLDTETGELKQSHFDGIVSIALRGIKLGVKEVITSIHEWRIENRGTRAA